MPSDFEFGSALGLGGWEFLGIWRLGLCWDWKLSVFWYLVFGSWELLGPPPLTPIHNLPMSSVDTHRASAPASVRCAVITVSDTRTEANDTSGAAIVQALTAAGHELVGRRILRDDPAPVAAAVRDAVGSADVIITTGGTGITARDSTYEAVASLFEKRIDGFGELFRMLSFQEIGAAAMLSRACAGSIRRTAIFSLPGSEHAVRLAMTRLIIPEVAHIVRELRR